MKTFSIRWLALAAAVFAGGARGAAVFPIVTNAGVILISPGGTAGGGGSYLVGINQNETNVCLQLVSSNGALAGPLLTVGASKGQPRVAFGSTNYLAFWGDDYISGAIDLYGQLVSPAGALEGPAFPLLQSLGAHGFQAEQAIAFDGTNFLAVWEDTQQFSSTFYGQFVTPAGALSGAEFLIGGAATGAASNPNANAQTALAFGATNYLFVWQIYAGDSPEAWSTYGAFISRSGSVGVPFPVSQTNSPSYNPLAVAFDGTNYLVVWNRDTGPGYPSPTVWNIDGRLVSPGGSFPGNEFTLVTNQAIYPSLAFDGANYLLSWIWSSQTNIFYQFLNRSAAPAGPAFTVSQLLQGTNNFNFGLGNIIFGGGKFLAGIVLGTAGYDSSGALTNIFSDSVYGAFIPASTASPSLAAGNRVGSQFTLQLTGTPGVNYAIQASTNLAAGNWTPVVTNSPANGAFNFTDPQGTNAGRFYRAVKQ